MVADLGARASDPLYDGRVIKSIRDEKDALALALRINQYRDHERIRRKAHTNYNRGRLLKEPGHRALKLLVDGGRTGFHA